MRVSTEDQAQHGTSLKTERERTLAYVEDKDPTRVREDGDWFPASARSVKTSATT